jgi:hypothetical protein
MSLTSLSAYRQSCEILIWNDILYSTKEVSKMMYIESNQSYQILKIQVFIRLPGDPCRALWQDLLKDSVGLDIAEVRATNRQKRTGISAYYYTIVEGGGIENRWNTYNVLAGRFSFFESVFTQLFLYSHIIRAHITSSNRLFQQGNVEMETSATDNDKDLERLERSYTVWLSCLHSWRVVYFVIDKG